MLLGIYCLTLKYPWLHVFVTSVWKQQGGHCKKCKVYFVYMEYRLIDSINIWFFSTPQYQYWAQKLCMDQAPVLPLSCSKVRHHEVSHKCWNCYLRKTSFFTQRKTSWGAYTSLIYSSFRFSCIIFSLIHNYSLFKFKTVRLTADRPFYFFLLLNQWLDWESYLNWYSYTVTNYLFKNVVSNIIPVSSYYSKITWLLSVTFGSPQ